MDDVSSSPHSPLSLDSYATAPPDAFDDSPAGLTDSESPSKKTYNKSSVLYINVNFTTKRCLPN